MIIKQLVDVCKRAFIMSNANASGKHIDEMFTFDRSWTELPALLNAVIENNDGYVWCIDTKRRYIAFNSAVSNTIQNVFGIEIKHGDKTYGVLEAIDPCRVNEWKNLYNFGFQGKPQQLIHEFSIYGQKVFFDIRLNPIKKESKVIGLCCFAKDITRQRLYVEQLKMAVAKARVETKEKERDEIGKELHDNVNQMLASANLYLGYALKHPMKEKAMLYKTIEFINSAIQELRQLSSTLIAPLASDKSLQENIKTLIQDIEFIQGKFIVCKVENLDENLLGKNIKTCIFRIIQEQLSNIIKYADASAVNIKIQQAENILELIIDDNGNGFDVNAKRNGIGISNIIDRAKANNGTVKIDSAPGHGCKLTARFQIPSFTV